MDLTRNADGSLLLTYDGTPLSRWLLGVGAIFLATGVYDMTIGTRGDERLIALAGGLATCVGAALVMHERARVHVDIFRRTIVWTRQWGLRRRAGTVPFGDVRHVALEVPIGDEGVPSRRIVLHLADGTTVPMTVGYRPDSDGVIANAATQLRLAVGLEGQPSADDQVRALVAGGRTIDAVKVLVEQEQLSLADAKARIDKVISSDKH